ncbi:MAG TPA: preprotein translocase subunit SecG [Gammaproteobacteria bacterium]|nr:preprotein translocase subunit SecG [Gammaproteobacteria bacterium]
MQAIQTILFVLQILVSISLIGFILIQHGKGADAGAAFGSGASSTVFGARGSGSFLTKATTVLAAIFLANSLALGYLATQRVKSNPGMMQQTNSVILKEQGEAPATPVENEVAPEAIDAAAQVDAGAQQEIPDTAPAPAPVGSDVPAVPEE